MVPHNGISQRLAECNSAIQRSAAQPQPAPEGGQKRNRFGCGWAALRCMYLAGFCARARSKIGNAVSILVERVHANKSTGSFMDQFGSLIKCALGGWDRLRFHASLRP